MTIRDKALCCVIGAFLGASGLPALAEPIETGAVLTGVLERVIDGDTFMMTTRRHGVIRVRLWGVNAPERSKSGYALATEALRALLPSNRRIGCTVKGYNPPKPPYEARIVATCAGRMTLDVAEVLVCQGHAVDVPKFSKGYYANREC